MSLASRRLATIAAVTVAALAPLACDDDPTSPPRLAERYTLTSVNGTALPTVRSADPMEDTIVAGSLHFRTDGRLARSLTLSSPAGTGRSAFLDTIPYGVRGSTVWMAEGVGDTLYGTLLRNGFEWTHGTGAGAPRYTFRAQ